MVRAVLAAGVSSQAPRRGMAASSLRVYSVCGVVHDLLDLAGLDERAVLHDVDPVRDQPGDPEVVGDHQDADAVLFLQFEQQVQDAGLHGDVQGAGGLVGHEQLAARWPARWRSGRAGACRRRAGAGTSSAAHPGSGCGPAPAAGWRGPGRRPCPSRPRRRSGWLRTAGCRWSARGSAPSWGPAGSARASCRGPCRSPWNRRSRPRRRSGPYPESTARSSGSSRRRPIAVVDFPEPDSPMMVTVSPRWMLKLTHVDGADDAGVGDQFDLEVADLQQRLSRSLFEWAVMLRHPSFLRRGRSRRPSPSRFTPTTMSTITRPGSVTSHQEVVM